MSRFACRLRQARQGPVYGGPRQVKLHMDCRVFFAKWRRDFCSDRPGDSRARANPKPRARRIIERQRGGSLRGSTHQFLQFNFGGNAEQPSIPARPHARSIGGDIQRALIEAFFPGNLVDGEILDRCGNPNARIAGPHGLRQFEIHHHLRINLPLHRGGVDLQAAKILESVTRENITDCVQSPGQVQDDAARRRLLAAIPDSE